MFIPNGSMEFFLFCIWSVFQLLYNDSIFNHGQAKHFYLIYSWTVMIVLLKTVNRIHGYEGYGKKCIIIFFQLDYFLLWQMRMQKKKSKFNHGLYQGFFSFIWLLHWLMASGYWFSHPIHINPEEIMRNMVYLKNSSYYFILFFLLAGSERWINRSERII